MTPEPLSREAILRAACPGYFEPTPYRRALRESGLRINLQPCCRTRERAAWARFIRLSTGFARHGLYMDRPEGRAPMNGFLTRAAGLPPECDHTYCLRDIRDRRPGRIVAIVIEPYRRLDHVGAESDRTYAEELTAWCDRHGVVWTDLGRSLALHNPDAPDTSAVLICRRGQFPPELELTATDRAHHAHVLGVAAGLAG